MNETYSAIAIIMAIPFFVFAYREYTESKYEFGRTVWGSLMIGIVLGLTLFAFILSY